MAEPSSYSNNRYTKYRPYLTIPELDMVLVSLRATGSNPNLIHYLSTFRDKITLGKMAPQLEIKPTLTDKLELSSLSGSSGSLSLSDQRRQAYNRWLLFPDKCSIQELARARMYRYENDLMSSEEESEYESQLDKGY